MDRENNKPLASGLEMPESRQECYIGGTPNGKRFLELMHRDTKDMSTMKGLNNNHDPWRADDRVWFEDSIYAMLEGRRAGEPYMMFLFAELFYRSTEFRIVYCEVEELDTDSAYWFLEAAKAGSVHAMLWCAWCMDQGIKGFSKDPLASAAMLEHMPKIPKTLGLSEMQFLKVELLSLVDQAYEADLEEDEVTDYYDSRLHYTYDDYKCFLPNPDWRILHIRYVALGTMMVDMGLPYVLEEYGYNYEWTSHFYDAADLIKQEKNSLLDWCRGKGMDIDLV